MPRPGRPIIVTYPTGEQKTFGSIKEAAEELGMIRQSIQRYLDGRYTRCEAGYSFKYVRSGVKISIRFPDHTIKTVPSVTEAARQTGISRPEINRYLSGEYKKNRAGYSFRATAPGDSWENAR